MSPKLKKTCIMNLKIQIWMQRWLPRAKAVRIRGR